jgi:hypothetical protein
VLSEPRVDRAALTDAVRTSYGITVDSLRFIPVGWASACYEIDQLYFLKLWLTPDDAARAVARLPVVQHLHDTGFRARLPYGADGRLSALDWDTALLGPPERDLSLLLHGEQPVDDHALRRVLAIYPADVPLELDLFAFFLLRRYVEDYSARATRLQEAGLSAANADEARDGMVTWGSAQWSRLDQTLALVRDALADRGA